MFSNKKALYITQQPQKTGHQTLHDSQPGEERVMATASRDTVFWTTENIQKKLYYGSMD